MVLIGRQSFLKMSTPPQRTIYPAWTYTRNPDQLDCCELGTTIHKVPRQCCMQDVSVASQHDTHHTWHERHYGAYCACDYCLESDQELLTAKSIFVRLLRIKAFTVIEFLDNDQYYIILDAMNAFDCRLHNPLMSVQRIHKYAHFDDLNRFCVRHTKLSCAVEFYTSSIHASVWGLMRRILKLQNATLHLVHPKEKQLQANADHCAAHRMYYETWVEFHTFFLDPQAVVEDFIALPEMCSLDHSFTPCLMVVVVAAVRAKTEMTVEDFQHFHAAALPEVVILECSLLSFPSCDFPLSQWKMLNAWANIHRIPDLRAAETDERLQFDQYTMAYDAYAPNLRRLNEEEYHYPELQYFYGDTEEDEEEFKCYE